MERSKKEFVSGSGIPIKEIYTPEDVADINYNQDIGSAGKPPFTRGVYPDMYRGRLWTIRRFSGVNTPEDTNQLYRREYELGQTGFSIAFDPTTEAGIDSDDPRVFADTGATGVPVDSLLDMEVMFEGLPIDKVSTAVVSPSLPACPLTAMYFAMAEKRGLDIKQLNGTTMNDLILTLGCLWLLDQIPPPAEFRLSTDLIEWCCEHAPQWHPACLDAYNYREHEITAFQELGMLLALAIEHIEEEKRRERVPLEKFIRVLAFNMGCHNDFFEEIAKFRAGRRMWYKIVTERYGIDDPSCGRFRLHVQSSGCTHTTQEPLNNLMRITCQMLAATLGGVQSMHANGYDEGICLPTEEAMLLSIRTEQILQHETNVINTVDPLGGSWYVEWLTSELERHTWEYIQKIEDAGGVADALDSGWIHREFKKAFLEYECKVASGKKVVIGVNKFQLEKEIYEVPISKPDPNAPQIQIEKIKRLKKERDNTEVIQALQELEEVTRSGENVMPAVMKAVKAYATLGEICNVWRKVYGLWHNPMRI